MNKVYEKTVSNARHLFLSETGVPAADDVQVTYTDKDGADITPALEDIFKCGPEHSITWTHGDTTKELQAWADDYNIIPGGLTRPITQQYKHTISMTVESTAFNVFIENESEVEFDKAALIAYLVANHYTTGEGNFYDNLEITSGEDKAEGIAVKGADDIVCNLSGSSSASCTFVKDTVTPAN